MSFGRYAYRHAAAPASTPFIDHVWISEELLTSTFRRFVNGQRRYESRVPGPLEARRRLAKRRNTALASVAGSGPMDDIACLFGRNGREHMKWSELGGRSLDYQFASPNPPAAPVSFYNENLNAFELQNPLQGWSGVRDRDRHRDGTEKLTRDQFFGEQLREYRTAGALKDAIRELDIDLRQEPSYSRLIFDHLISQSVRAKANVHELALFLDDPQLNIPGAGNYLGVVEHYVSRGIRLSKRHALFDTVIRALELGIVPPKEIDAIVNGLSELGRTDKGVKRQDEKLQTQLYRRMWDAIGKCGIYGHQDLDEPIVDNWLGVLLEKDTVDDFLLAKDILLATNYDMPTNSLWLSKFVTRWLYDPVHSLSKFDGKHVIEFLKPFNADLISKSVIGVTEALFTSGKTHLLKRWGSCLARLHDTPAITSSHAWTHIRVNHDGTSHRAPMSPRHQIIQRLWILYTMNKGVSGSSLPAPESSVPNPTIKNLYRLYESARRDGNEDLWSSLTKGIHDLNIPFDLQAMADDLRTGKSITDATRRTLQKYETSPLSFAEIFADLHTFNAAGPIFFHNIEKMVRRIDIASPSFRKHATHTARTGDTHQVWTLIRLLRLHTPLKLALSKSWHPIDPADKALVRDDPNPRPALHPDPHAALDLIHALAAAFACSDQLSPRRAFELVRWLYVFVYRHGAPVRPPLARSLYHAGVDRFRREKSHVSMTQYEYILNIVEQVEGPEVVDALKSRSFEDPEDFEDYD